MPTPKPIVAGRNAIFPRGSDSSIAGIRRLQTDAATITPAAKPVSPRCTERFISPRIKNTHAAPRDVPRKGINNPQNTSDIKFLLIQLVGNHFNKRRIIIENNYHLYITPRFDSCQYITIKRTREGKIGRQLGSIGQGKPYE